MHNRIFSGANRHYRIKIIKGAAVLTLIFILVGTLMPGKDKIAVLLGSGRILNSVTEGGISHRHVSNKGRSRKKQLSSISLVIEKSGHFILFGCLALLLAMGNTKIFKLSLILNMGVLASGTEFLQIFIPGRCPQVTDMMIDMSGVLFALTLLWGFKKCWGYGVRVMRGGPR